MVLKRKIGKYNKGQLKLDEINQQLNQLQTIPDIAEAGWTQCILFP